MPSLTDLLRRRPEAQKCPACGSALPAASVFCPSCGIRVDDPDSQPLHIVDRVTGLFNDRFIRPVLEDELARAHRYGRPVGVLLIEAPRPGEAVPGSNGDPAAADPGEDEEVLKQMGTAVAGTLRDVDTPGVLGRRPPQLLAILPDTDISGTAHAANRVVGAVNSALAPAGRRALVGLVCVHHGSRLRAGAVIEAAARSLRSGRPELLGR
jgi:PleD family two-component response regulator